MARATWSGTIGFGMVSIPVKLYPATDNAKRISFNQLNKATNNRIAQKKVDSVTGDELSQSDIVKGYEIAKGTYVVVDTEELDALLPDKTRAIEIVSMIDADAIDPIYHDTPYFLGCSEGGEKPYHLLREAMSSTNKAAIGRFVMNTKEYLVLIRPMGEGLAISTLRWSDQIRDIDQFTPTAVDISEREMAMATTLVESMSDEQFDISQYTDEHRERVMELIRAKHEGKEIARPAQPAKEPEDLFAALEASLTQAKERQKA